jgi:hypothetical protein
MAYGTTTAIRETGVADGRFVACLAKAAQVFKKGDIVVIDATDGLAYKAYADAGYANGDIFAGIANDSKIAAAGDTDTIVVDTEGIHELTIAATNQATAVGRPVYHEIGEGTAQTVTLTAPAPYLRIGIVTGLVSTTKVLVDIEGFLNIAAGAD